MSNLDMNQLMGMLNNMDKNDLQNAINKANEVINSDDKDALKNMVSNLETSSKQTKGENNSSSNASDFNIDPETILKMKSMINSMNNKNDPRANLLYSLKPYLRENRKDKLDQYVNLLNITKLADFMKNNKKENDGNA